MSKVCKKYVDDCICVIRLVATSGIIHENMVFLTLVVVCLCCRSQIMHGSPKIRTLQPACLFGCFCLFRLDTSFMLKVRLNPLNRQTVRFPKRSFWSFSPADQELLDGNLMSEPYQIMDRILRKQVAAKRSKLLTRTILCHCLRSSFNRAGANNPRTPSGWF